MRKTWPFTARGIGDPHRHQAMKAHAIALLLEVTACPAENMADVRQAVLVWLQELFCENGCFVAMSRQPRLAVVYHSARKQRGRKRRRRLKLVVGMLRGCMYSLHTPYHVYKGTCLLLVALILLRNYQPRTYAPLFTKKFGETLFHLLSRHAEVRYSRGEGRWRSPRRVRLQMTRGTFRLLPSEPRRR